MCNCNRKWTFWHLDFYQTVRNPKSIYIFIKPQLFTFGPELFIVGTQTIINKNWTTYAHRLQIQRFQFFLTWRILSASFLLDNLIITFIELFLVLSQWQSSTFLGATSRSSSSRTIITVSYNSPTSVSDDIPNISRHSRLE